MPRPTRPPLCGMMRRPLCQSGDTVSKEVYTMRGLVSERTVQPTVRGLIQTRCLPRPTRLALYGMVRRPLCRSSATQETCVSKGRLAKRGAVLGTTVQLLIRGLVQSEASAPPSADFAMRQSAQLNQRVSQKCVAQRRAWPHYQITCGLLEEKMPALLPALSLS